MSADEANKMDNVADGHERRGRERGGRKKLAVGGRCAGVGGVGGVLKKKRSKTTKCRNGKNRNGRECGKNRGWEEVTGRLE